MAGAGVQGHTAGFAIIEHSASGMGNAFAGAAAVAEDASTIYFNPAGMTYLPGSQMVVAGHGIFPKADFSDRGSNIASTKLSDDGGVSKFVPNFYFSYQLNEKLFAGVGINAPFGLATEYDDNWVGRYQAVKSEITTLNINPSLAYKLNDQLSIGGGISAQYIKATLTNALDYSPLSAPDGNIEVEGSDWSWGFNLGAIYQFTDTTRIGLAYRSRIKQDLEGRANFENIPPPVSFVVSDSRATASVDLPETASLSLSHDVNGQWTLLADVTWTNWSRFDELVIKFENPGMGESVQPENWEDSWRYSIGVVYRPNQTWTFRSGLAYDETPIPSATDRTPRIPGNDRTWIALGVGYRISDTMAVDVGYAHLFVDDTRINDTSTDGLGNVHNLVGEYNSTVDIISAQLTVDF